MPLLARLSLGCIGLTAAITAIAAPLKPPATPERPVVDYYFDSAVKDPYRWMEDTSSLEFRHWLRDQADFTRQTLAALPGREPLAQRLRQLADGGETLHALEARNGRLFYLKSEPGRNQPRLFVRPGGDGGETLLLDPGQMAAEGGHWSIDFFTPAPDGRRIAIGLSQGGSEDSEIRIWDIADARWLPDRVPLAGLNEHGISWRPDGQAFFYNRTPARDAGGRGDRYLRSAVHLHELGKAAADDITLFGYGVAPEYTFEPADVPYLTVSAGSPYALATVLHGDSVDRSFFVAPLDRLHGANIPWRRIAGPADQISHAYLLGREIFLLSHKNAPRAQLLSLDLEQTRAKPRPRLPAGPLVLEDAVASGKALYLRALDGGANRLFRIPGQGPAKELTTPYSGSIRHLAADSAHDQLFFSLEDWTRPPAVFRSAGNDRPAAVPLLAPTRLDTSAYVAKRIMVPSHDGIFVPLSIIHRKDLLFDGQRPTILSGYGAYGIVQRARFNPQRLAWLDLGGVLAVAHVRGGGELGEEWHRGAHILNKDNTIKDFIACAEYLIDAGYTRRQRLAGSGGSAGGLTVGGALVQRPDLFAAIHSAVGLSDLLRMELTRNGPPNIAEFGTVTVKEQFETLYRLSPYHRIRDGERYPALIATTGVNDPRVDAWMPAKLAARLQKASASGKPVLLRVDFDSGHGHGATRDQAIAETADVWSFLLWQMAVPGFVPANPAP